MAREHPKPKHFVSCGRDVLIEREMTADDNPKREGERDKESGETKGVRKTVETLTHAEWEEKECGETVETNEKRVRNCWNTNKERERRNCWNKWVKRKESENENEEEADEFPIKV